MKANLNIINTKFPMLFYDSNSMKENYAKCTGRRFHWGDGKPIKLTRSVLVSKYPISL